jgi:biopolymer transport protein ExbD
LADNPLLGRPPHREPPEFDVTPMVDLVFMMNIYFMVTFITLALAEIALPEAAHGGPLDADASIVFTVRGSLDGKSIAVTVGTGDEARPIADGDAQTEQIIAAVEEGVAAGKKDVLIKAEKKVRLGEVFRIASAAASVEGVKLHDAVTEKEAE